MNETRTGRVDETPRRLIGVLLDVDGTLVDSNDAHAGAWHDALTEAGRTDVPFEALRRCIGMGSDHMLPRVAGIDKESEEGRALCDRCSALFAERYLPAVRPFPRVRELLEALSGRGLRLAVTTSAARDKAGALLRAAGVEDLIEEVVTSADAPRSKPEPDIIEAGLRALGAGPTEVLLLGDTPYDIEAAARAGVGTVALRSGGWSEGELAGALAVYQDAADLLRELDGSPFAAPSASAHGA
jgi:HAD superfamily hydrolase (TIGR01509 family)